jgi:hypothetical protein
VEGGFFLRKNPLEFIGLGDSYPDFAIVPAYSPKTPSSVWHKRTPKTVFLVQKAVFLAPKKAKSAVCVY